ncbi:hypothetical protein EYF80_046047 [Liparis tanakae]|uniref:Uncharacterized protein n=1 Tax=Liparis tanakae TaxID=230148 RepID=A0A4Z2FRA8_9TELE|nr:hypothetical protein EYF80_046047 [Liparis tanakae]
MMVETCSALEWLHGRVEEMNGVVVAEIKVYSASYELMAGENEGHSFSKKAVGRPEVLEGVL